MKSFKLIFIASVLISLLSSCYTQQQFVTIPVSYTPKLSFAPQSTILLINKYDNSKMNAKEVKKIPVLNAGAYTAIKYAEKQLRELPNVKVISAIDSVHFVADTDSVKSLAAKYKANYILVLKDFKADVVADTDPNTPPGYNTVAEVSFMLYQPDGIYFKKLNGKGFVPLNYGIEPGSFASLFARPSVKGSKISIVPASQFAAQDALQDYLPYEFSHNRPLFDDAVFQPAIKEILASNFEKADTLLKPFLESKDPLIVCKAAYNLAVVYEGEGDIGLAIDMAKLSLTKVSNTYATWILSDLKTE